MEGGVYEAIIGANVATSAGDGEGNYARLPNLHIYEGMSCIGKTTAVKNGPGTDGGAPSKSFLLDYGEQWSKSPLRELVQVKGRSPSCASFYGAFLGDAARRIVDLARTSLERGDDAKNAVYRVDRWTISDVVYNLIYEAKEKRTDFRELWDRYDMTRALKRTCPALGNVVVYVSDHHRLIVDRIVARNQKIDAALAIHWDLRGYVRIQYEAWLYAAAQLNLPVVNVRDGFVSDFHPDMAEMV